MTHAILPKQHVSSRSERIHCLRLAYCYTYSQYTAVSAMDDGDDSSPAGSAELLPLFGRRSPAADLEEKLRRAREENRRLAGSLAAILDAHPHLRDLATPRASVVATARAPSGSANAAREEAAGATAGSSREPTAEPRPCVRTVCVRVDPSDPDTDLTVKDDYQWRKYGQKVTRDNPYPRAYFRCAFSPSCPVKKKVQRSAEDRSMLVATYVGEHSHTQPTQSEFVSNDGSTSQAGSLPCSISINSSGQTITLDLTNHQESGSSLEAISRAVVTPEFQKLLMEEMVNLLKDDAEFVESLTSAVAARILEIIPDRLL